MELSLRESTDGSIEKMINECYTRKELSGSEVENPRKFCPCNSVMHGEKCNVLEEQFNYDRRFHGDS